MRKASALLIDVFAHIFFLRCTNYRKQAELKRHYQELLETGELFNIDFRVGKMCVIKGAGSKNPDFFRAQIVEILPNGKFRV